MSPAWIAVIGTLASGVVGGLVAWLIARQNRAAQRDVAHEQAESVYRSKREEVEADAYTHARETLSDIIQSLERELTRSRVDANDARAQADACALKVREQAGQIETLQGDVRHLNNQDKAKQRIIDTMRSELTDAQAALRLAHPDEV